MIEEMATLLTTIQSKEEFALLRTVRAECRKGLVVAGAGRRLSTLGCRARAAGCKQQPNEQKMYESNRFHRFHRFLMDFCRKDTTFPHSHHSWVMEKFMECKVV